MLCVILFSLGPWGEGANVAVFDGVARFGSESVGESTGEPRVREGVSVCVSDEE